ncbi:carboxypeptidase M32 [Spirochaetia bacterium]|nr:carboxypeptidase M32 [Spirochaetia bacterium]
MESVVLLEKLHRIDRECRHLEKVAAALQWDQETYLPSGGVEDRSEQLALLQGIAHERLSSPETGQLLAGLGSVSDYPRGDEKLPSLERDFLNTLRRNYDRAVKLPPDFVTDAARAEGLSQAAWAQARRNDDFPSFLPHLRSMIDFARRKSEYWGFGGEGKSPGGHSGDRAQGGQGLSVYDGLLDIYEPGMPAADIGAVFGPLRDRLVSLLKKIKLCPPPGTSAEAEGRGSPPDTGFLNQDYDVGRQASFNQRLMDYLGFDRNRGRLDISAHPFTASLGSDDVRITTRYFPQNPLSGMFSVIHESGHAFYEMGFPPELRGTCLADGASMAFHESQSRFWENVIGRSRPFWEGLYPILQSYFPGQLGQVPADTFYRALNQVKPSLIRVDADEVSYALHIILRFELEKQLISGELDPEKLPDVWRKYSREYLGLESETDADGVLQDVHWSMGAFGYFPSYALGNLYGLQIAKKLRSDIPGLDSTIAQGKFGEIRSWLGDKVYRWGHRLSPAELLLNITGEKLSAEPFLEYIESKYTELYGL